MVAALNALKEKRVTSGCLLAILESLFNKSSAREWLRLNRSIGGRLLKGPGQIPHNAGSK